MNDIEDIGYNSDEEINKKQHARLLDEVLQLDKRKLVKKPSRTEPTTHVSEFNLVKRTLGKKNKVSLNNLTQSLKDEEKHVAITKKVKSSFKVKTLPKPLEKPQADRVRRSLGFEKTKDQLNKWNSIIEKNRVASQLSFPLNQGAVHFVTGEKRKKLPPRYKSELDKELEKLEPVVETIVVEEKFPLNMEELVSQRKEMAKLRARQSYQEAKARKQHKIKSKKYHRVQRKERLKQQIKEFEELQKTDPEAALQKLEQLEKTRVEERMTLRHRSTGQWAKSKQVRAKYDKESRQALAKQLSISRDLTQKIKNNNSSDSENDEEIPIKPSDQSNPWTSQKPNEFTDFVSGYRKYWTEKNKLGSENPEEEEKIKKEFLSLKVTDEEKSQTAKNEAQKSDKKIKNSKNNITEKNNKITPKNKKNKNSEIVNHANNSWTVTSASSEDEKEPEEPSIFDNKNVEDLFDNLEFKVQMKTTEKLSKLKEESQNTKKRKLETVKEPKEKKSDLSFKPEILRPVVDEELGRSSSESEDEVSAIKNTLKVKKTKPEMNSEMNSANKNKQDIDPNKYISAKPIELNTKLPNMSMGDDESDEDDQRAFISEAFADDDVIEDFNKDKKNIIDADTPKDIDLSLPGWGSWGGKNLKVSKRKKRRFIMKAPKVLPRRDENKGNLIINEKKDVKIKKHQVADVPFPFKSVKDFEASIRAPIGDTFVPQTAFRRLIKPAIKTKKGEIIEPMTEDVLLKQKFTKQGRMVNK